MAFTMPSFMSRLMSPFRAYSQMSVAAGEAGASVNIPEGAERAIVASGCFWGTEHIFRKEFKGKGLYDARVGYAGGKSRETTYKDVCRGNRGDHAESLDISYDPNQITYTQILEFFFRTHDPTTLDRQGNDEGRQYRSAIFPINEDQEVIAKRIKEKVNAQWWNGKVTTEIKRIDPKQGWFDGEIEHQKYLDINPYGYQCPTHFVRNNLPPLK